MSSEANRVFLEFDDSLTNVRRMFATELVRDLEQVTPKKTGFAASGWNIDYGDSLGPAENTPNRDEAKIARVPGRISRMMASLAAFLAVRRGRIGGVLRVYNDTAYIGKLNSGSSSQAPAGFIQTSIAAVAARIQSFVNSNASRMSGTSRSRARQDIARFSDADGDDG